MAHKQTPFVIIYNPSSAGGSAMERLVELALDEYGDQLLGTFQTNPNHITLPDVAEDVRFLIAGGDGTVFQAMQEIVKKNLKNPVGVLPFGTGNLLAKSFQLPLRPKAALEYALQTTPRLIDALRINDEYTTLLGTGVGFQSTLMQATPNYLKRIFGMTGYFIGGLKLVFPVKLFHATIHIDQTEITANAINSVMIMKNLRAFEVDPFGRAQPDDGKLHVFTCHQRNINEFLEDVYQLSKGARGKLSKVQHYEGSHVTLSYPDTIPFQIDGDVYADTLRTVSVLPRQINFLM